MNGKFRWTGHRKSTIVDARKLNEYPLHACSIKISAVCSFVLSQSTPMSDGHNFDSQDRACVCVARQQNTNEQVDPKAVGTFCEDMGSPLK